MRYTGNPGKIGKMFELRVKEYLESKEFVVSMNPGSFFPDLVVSKNGARFEVECKFSSLGSGRVALKQIENRIWMDMDESDFDSTFDRLTNFFVATNLGSDIIFYDLKGKRVDF